MFLSRQAAENLAIYSLAHALIDCVCLAILFRLNQTGSLPFSFLASLFILYNVLAFGLQPVFGLLVDAFARPRAGAILGLILTALAVLFFYFMPVLAVIFAGLGNALFHVSAGAISLSLTPGRAAAPGIFVAPGAIGLFIGIMLGQSQIDFMPVFFVLLIIFCFLFLSVKPVITAYFRPAATNKNLSNFLAVFVFLFLAIMARSWLGSAVIFSWKSVYYLSVILALAVFAGKLLGGFIGDRFGWQLTGVLALIVSLPLLTLGTPFPFLALTGMFLVNITMPLTLVATSNLFPNRPAFAFGLTCLALLFGYLLSISSIKPFLSLPSVIGPIIILAAVFLFFGLKKFEIINN